ncbi:MAG: TetR/AcrR family transcriptional regulator [Acidovorax temperans]|uniref:TetR/AcrR family transcriptional regulator n=1 Tax=Acidovorax temperans TaxID=80878 RepID=UPI00391C6BAB
MDARTRDIAAAVGLTWGAFSLRLGSKRALFEQAMRSGITPAEDAHSDGSDAADLTALLRQLAWCWSQQWPAHLQWHIASTTTQQRTGPADELQQSLTLVLKRHAERGEVRRDLPAYGLAALVLSVLIGHAAAHFMRGHQNTPPPHALVQTVLHLITTAHPPLWQEP